MTRSGWATDRRNGVRLDSVRRRRPAAVITDAAQSPAEELRQRQTRYIVMMLVRAGFLVLAAVLAMLARAVARRCGWSVCLAGAVILPWLAVILAERPRPRPEYRLGNRFRPRPAPDAAGPAARWASARAHGDRRRPVAFSGRFGRQGAANVSALSGRSGAGAHPGDRPGTEDGAGREALGRGGAVEPPCQDRSGERVAGPGRVEHRRRRCPGTAITPVAVRPHRTGRAVLHHRLAARRRREARPARPPPAVGLARRRQRRASARASSTFANSSAARPRPVQERRTTDRPQRRRGRRVDARRRAPFGGARERRPPGRPGRGIEQRVPGEVDVRAPASAGTTSAAVSSPLAPRSTSIVRSPPPESTTIEPVVAPGARRTCAAHARGRELVDPVAAGAVVADDRRPASPTPSERQPRGGVRRRRRRR